MAEHTGFIIAAYGVTAVVMLGTIVTILVDQRSLRRTLERLERRLPEGLRDDAGR